MALQKDTVSINIANSLDQKTDNKLIQPNKLASVRNRRFTKVGSLSKRPGQEELSREVITSYSDALEIEASQTKSTVASFKDQLVLSNRGAFYAKRSTEDAWQFKGHTNYLDIGFMNVAGSGDRTVQGDAVLIDGKTVVVGRTSTLGDNLSYFYYSVLETETSIYLAKSVRITQPSSDACFIRVVGVGSNALIFFTEGSNIKRAAVDLTTGALGSIVTLKTNVGFSATFDLSVLENSVLGPVVAVVYRQSTSGMAIFLCNSLGVEITTPPAITNSNNPLSSVSLFHDPALGANKFFLAYESANLGAYEIRLAGYSVGVATISLDFGPVNVSSANDVYASVAQIVNPKTGNILILLDTLRSYSDASNQLSSKPNSITYTIEANIDFAECSPTGTPTVARSRYSTGVRLAGRPFVDSERETVLIPTVYDSAISSQYHICDFSYGKSPGAFFSQAKWFYGRAQAPLIDKPSLSLSRVPPLPQVNFLSATEIVYFGMNRTKILGRDTSDIVSGTIQADGVPFYEIVPSLQRVSLETESARSTIQLSSSLYLSGAQLEHYDGNTISEAGFLVDPEKGWASISNSPVTLNFVNGTVSTRASLEITFSPGSAFIPLGVATSRYITFDTPTTDYYIWFQVDGVGTDPALAGRTGFKATVLSTMSPGEIAQRVALTAGPYLVTYLSRNFENDTIIILNDANGAVTAPTTSNLGYSSGGEISFEQGSYQYCAVWKWIDAQGLTHRSAPSTPITVELSADVNGYGAVTFIVPPITNKNVSECQVEIYRTTNGGQTFYNLTKLQDFNSFDGILPSFSWPTTGSRFTYTDSTPDSELTKSIILYTTGGVLPNFSPGLVRHISSHQSRVLVTTEDENQITFSKALVDDSPIEFAIENEIRANSDDGAVSGHATLDDKIIMGKEESLYVSAGQFPNDLGTQGTLSIPQRIAADTGILDHNSTIVYPDGLIFKSKKGFYRLSRALQLDYIGQAVEDFNQFKVACGVLDTLNNEIRFYLQDSTSMLLYDYLQDKWGVWDNSIADSACVHKNVIYRVENSGKVHKSTEGVFKDITLDGSGNEVVGYYGSHFELPWLKLKGLQDFQRIWFAALLGGYKSPHEIEAKFYYDYNDTETDTLTANSEDIKTGVYQWEIKPRIQKCQAIKIKFTETPDADFVGQTGESADFTDVSFTVGLKRGLNKVSKAKRD